MKVLPPLVLASGSPRRADFLRMLGISFEIRTVPVEEDMPPGEDPASQAERLATKKAVAVSRVMPGRLVLGGDTVVALDGVVLGKPSSADEAVDMLVRLAGRSHAVSSGLALARDGAAVCVGVRTTRVTFRSFDANTARSYVDTGEPMDKAGAYGIQGLGSTLVDGIEGDHSTVVGLPIPLLVELLNAAGRPYRFPVTAPPAPATVLLAPDNVSAPDNVPPAPDTDPAAPDAVP